MDAGARERRLDQPDRLAAYLAKVTVVLVHPAEELQFHAGRRVLHQRPGGRRIVEHAVDVRVRFDRQRLRLRSEEHTSELQSLMRISYAVFCLKKKKAPIDLT